MVHRIVRTLSVTAILATVLVIAAPAALAHEEREVGPFELAVGFGTEPAYVGQPNSVQMFLGRDGEPVTELGDTLDVEVAFGDNDPLQLTMEPFFEVGEFGTPGDYRAWFIPTSVGQYTFHLTGTIDGQDVDETFTSGPTTFSDVESGTDIMYPVQPPTTSELAERIDREVPRLNDAIDQAQTAAVGQAQDATDDAASARTLGVIGIVAGALGLVVAIGAIMTSRRKVA
jgi:hypothetical protein